MPLPAGDKNYVHRQNTPAVSWAIVHNLKKIPAIQVFDSADTEVQCKVTLHPSDPLNKLTITVSAAFSGKCVCN